ncbi:hypothetical protein TNCV_3223751 [Trichonephila clavipes]|nr:hypothetical protein TNCV_3223751 [Trichonephila clavipes]
MRSQEDFKIVDCWKIEPELNFHCYPIAANIDAAPEELKLEFIDLNAMKLIFTNPRELKDFHLCRNLLGTVPVSSHWALGAPRNL